MKVISTTNSSDSTCSSTLTDNATVAEVAEFTRQVVANMSTNTWLLDTCRHLYIRICSAFRIMIVLQILQVLIGIEIDWGNLTSSCIIEMDVLAHY